jgi:hypothetical protein
LRRTGFLYELMLNISGTVTTTAGTVIDAEALVNYLPSILIKSPQGAQIHAYSMRSLFDLNYRRNKVVTPRTDPSFANVAIGTSGSQNVNINLWVPLSINSGLNVKTGLLMRQIANNDFTLEMVCAATGDLVPAGGGTPTFAFTGFTLNITVTERWCEAINPNAIVDPPKFNQIVKVRDQQTGPLMVGDNFVNYPIQPVLLEVMHRIVENGAASSTHLNFISLLADFQNLKEQRYVNEISEANFQHLGKALQAGIVHQDFLDDAEAVNETRSRDWINSLKASQLDFDINTTSAFTSNGNSVVSQMFRELVAMAVYGS